VARRHPNHRLIKIHRSYSVEEVAATLGVHKNTVRNWLRHGLKANDSSRPLLIHGQGLVGFLQARRQANKQRCKPGEIYCVRCRTPVSPAGSMADYLPLAAASGNLRGICPHCDTLVHRRVSLARIDTVRGDLDISFPQARERIGEGPPPTVNCDLKAAE
jgi:hypothetical protein